MSFKKKEEQARSAHSATWEGLGLGENPRGIFMFMFLELQAPGLCLVSWATD